LTIFDPLDEEHSNLFSWQFKNDRLFLIFFPLPIAFGLLKNLSFLVALFCFVFVFVFFFFELLGQEVIGIIFI
jgi:hypothetical protein